MGSDGCLVASAVFKTVEGSYAALVGSIPSLSAKEETLVSVIPSVCEILGTRKSSILIKNFFNLRLL